MFVLLALLAPLVAPHDPVEQSVDDRYLAPSWQHPMGTDKFGRDIMSRVFYGSRASLGIGVLAMLMASIIGAAVGAIAGYRGGWLDEVVMRAVDGLLAFPRLLFVLTLVALFTTSFWVVIVMLGVTGWMGLARLVRTEVRALKEREFVEAAVSTGARERSVIWRHLLPNILGPVIVTATLRIGTIILLESYLSFLGLGIQPPTPSWGLMVFEGREVLLSAWWVSAFPGMFIVLTVVACNLFGDGLRDALDVRSD